MATKKVIVEKEEGVGEIIDRILNEPDRALVIVVPKGSTLGKSARNFNFIKRESASAGKEISVESVDENILALAKNAGMAINHPLLRERGVSGVSGISDIVPIVREDEIYKENNEGEPVRGADEPSRDKRRAVSRKSAPTTRNVSGEAIGEREEENFGHEEGIASEDIHQEEESFFREEDRFFKKRQIPVVSDSDDEEGETPHRPIVAGKWILWAVVALIVLAAALYGITVVFGSAKINITFKKTPWAYNGNFTAEKTVSQINAVQNLIPAQVFLLPKNITQPFLASGQEKVSQKAQGVVTIYNAYSSSPQSLVAATRFVTPDGKIFRLVNAVVVPGAAVTNGAIVPSSINTLVVASSSGSDYNVGPIPKLTIPGFKGSPKYGAFYGAIASGTSGGFIGEKAVPTANDITAAKQKTTDILIAALQGDFEETIPSNFKILPGATTTQITKITVNTSTDANGKFSVFGEGTLFAIGFDESSDSPTTSLKYLLLSRAQSTEVSSTFNDFMPFDYASVTPDFMNGKLSFSVNAQESLEPAFSADDFRGTIAGKKINDAKDVISSLTQLQEGTISVWPAWLWQIPSNTNKIQVSVD
jgi:hypothetical protein